MLLSLICPFLAPLLLYDKTIKKSNNNSFLGAHTAQGEENMNINEDEANAQIRKKNIKNRINLEDLSQDTNENSSYANNIYSFFQSPLVKFAYHKLSFLLFLLFFSYYVLCDYPIDSRQAIKWTEIILIIWVYSYFIEAVHQCYIQDTKLYLTKLKFFLSEYWNIFDLVAITVFTIALILRYIPGCDNCLTAAEYSFFRT